MGQGEVARLPADRVRARVPRRGLGDRGGRAVRRPVPVAGGAGRPQAQLYERSLALRAIRSDQASRLHISLLGPTSSMHIWQTCLQLS